MPRATDTGKVCSRCPEKGEQDLENFSKNRHKRDGLTDWCKSCVADYHKVWYTDNKLTKDGQNRSYYHANKDRFREYALLSKYGLTLEGYDLLYEQQSGVCALCGQPETARDGRSGQVRRLAVDHCHETGRIRGLLCYRCNHLIGCLGDNPASIEHVLEYMTER